MLTEALYVSLGSAWFKVWFSSWILGLCSMEWNTVSCTVEICLLNSKGICFLVLTAFPMLSHPSKSFLIQKHPWWVFSNVNCLVEHEQVRLKVRRSRPHAGYCPLLVSFVEDYHGRKAGGPNISSLSSHSPMLRSRFWKGSVLMCFWKC